MDNNHYSSYEIYSDKPYKEYEQPNEHTEYEQPIEHKKDEKPNKNPNKTILLIIIIAAVIFPAMMIMLTSLISGDHEYEADGITYLYEDNTLYVSGDGDMPAISSDDEHFLAKKLHVKADDIEAVIIEEGITTIGENSFSDYRNLVTLELPESLEVIDAGAFLGCESLEDFAFPEYLEEIGFMAFFGCNSLTCAFLPPNVFKIGDAAFSHCDSIENAEIYPSILGDSVFEGCPMLRVIAVYGDITSVSDSMFKDCESLYAISLTEEIDEICENAFYGCDGLELVEFEGTRKQWENIDVTDGNDILDEVDINFGDGTGIEHITNIASTYGNDSSDAYDDKNEAPSDSDTSSKSSGNVTFTAIDGTVGARVDEECENLFDTDTNTKWCVVNFSDAYVIWEASEKVAATGYTIVTAHDTLLYKGRNPSSWTLYGCNAGSAPDRNDSGWKVIDTQTDDTILEGLEAKRYEYTLDSKAPGYEYFMLVIDETKGDDCMQMSEFMLNYDGRKYQPRDGGSNSGGSGGGSGGDNTPCVYCNNGRCNTCGGSGLVEESYYSGGERQTRTVHCGDCSFGSCRVCGGDGWI